MFRKPQPRPATSPPAPSRKVGTIAHLVQQRRAKNNGGK